MTRSDSACRAIRAASTESEVVEAVSQYIRSLNAGAVALLPVGLLTIGLAHAEEVIHSALELVHAKMIHSKGTPEADTMSEVVLVLTTAARRFAALAKTT